eukprot:c35535_g1_i1 orf=175-366(+)
MAWPFAVNQFTKYAAVVSRQVTNTGLQSSEICYHLVGTGIDPWPGQFSVVLTVMHQKCSVMGE